MALDAVHEDCQEEELPLSPHMVVAGQTHRCIPDLQRDNAHSTEESSPLATTTAFEPRHACSTGPLHAHKQGREVEDFGVAC